MDFYSNRLRFITERFTQNCELDDMTLIDQQKVMEYNLSNEKIRFNLIGYVFYVMSGKIDKDDLTLL